MGYSTETEGTLMDSYEMVKDSILHSKKVNLFGWGITNPQLIGGQWGTHFGLHIEDKALWAMNMLVYGRPKNWIIAPPSECFALEKKVQEEILPEIQNKTTIGRSNLGPCTQFLRHKTLFLTPKYLSKAKIKFHRVTQRENQMIVVFPGAYHQGYNLGPNIAESVNFGTEEWLQWGKHATECGCGRNKEPFSMDPFVKEFQGDAVFEMWKKDRDPLPHPEWPEWRQNYYREIGCPKLAKALHQQEKNVKELLREKDEWVKAIDEEEREKRRIEKQKDAISSKYKACKEKMEILKKVKADMKSAMSEGKEKMRLETKKIETLEKEKEDLVQKAEALVEIEKEMDVMSDELKSWKKKAEDLEEGKKDMESALSKEKENVRLEKEKVENLLKENEDLVQETEELDKIKKEMDIMLNELKSWKKKK